MSATLINKEKFVKMLDTAKFAMIDTNDGEGYQIYNVVTNHRSYDYPDGEYAFVLVNDPREVISLSEYIDHPDVDVLFEDNPRENLPTYIITCADPGWTEEDIEIVFVNPIRR